MLQYDVDKNGMIIKVQELKGGSYELTSEKVSSFPIVDRYDRWAAFKRAICTQELNVIMKYSGFKDKKELLRASHVLGRQTKDTFMKSTLNGTHLKIKSDTLNLHLYVSRVEK